MTDSPFRPTRWNLGILSSSAEEFLAMRTTGLAGTHVDTVSYGVLPCCFDGGNNRSKVCDVLRRGETGVTPAPEGWDDPDILMEGRDSLEIITEFCH